MSSITFQLSEAERAARDVLTRLAAGTDEFEGYAHPHAERVARLADELAQLFHLGRADRASLRAAALAHDLGEMAMRRDYIRRTGPLTEEERIDLARHPVIGEQEAARAGADRGAQLLVRWHHEWWNGAGYPDALRGEQIPLAARILRVADSYAALTDDRPFRRAATEDEARRHLAGWAGLEFDPRVVRAFLTLKNLPELGSYARRESGADDTASQPAAVGERLLPAPTSFDAGGVRLVPQGQSRDYADRAVGGRIPEMGTNPYVSQSTGGTAEPDGGGTETKATEASKADA